MRTLQTLVSELLEKAKKLQKLVESNPMDMLGKTPKMPEICDCEMDERGDMMMCQECFHKNKKIIYV